MDNCAEKTEGWDFFKGRGFSVGHFCIGSKKPVVSLLPFSACKQQFISTLRKPGGRMASILGGLFLLFLLMAGRKQKLMWLCWLQP